MRPFATETFAKWWTSTNWQ